MDLLNGPIGVNTEVVHLRICGTGLIAQRTNSANTEMDCFACGPFARCTNGWFVRKWPAFASAQTTNNFLSIINYYMAPSIVMCRELTEFLAFDFAPAGILAWHLRI